MIIPGVDNLLIGGRPISVDHSLHSSMRVMPPACTVVQAAGIAAAMSAAGKCKSSAIDGVTVHNKMAEAGLL